MDKPNIKQQKAHAPDSEDRLLYEISLTSDQFNRLQRILPEGCKLTVSDKNSRIEQKAGKRTVGFRKASLRDSKFEYKLKIHLVRQLARLFR